MNASSSSTTPSREQTAIQQAAYLVALAHRASPIDVPLGLRALELSSTIPGLLSEWRRTQAQNERASRLQSAEDKE